MVWYPSFYKIIRPCKSWTEVKSGIQFHSLKELSFFCWEITWKVLSNGIYKSVLHRATVHTQKKRISIASLHSLALGKKVKPASKLVNQHILSNKEGSFGDFLDFISAEDIKDANYMDKLKMNS
ncbi:putative 1-aminocyclopropane-1-carboxylate oxidase -like protein [Capsicum annuum]|uniref:Isopenicillin N synthase-like Fe(2+) 2OG dioxygenase domain-containing protein n=1 Tax=Capsicum annuum TaxID=4072 RepID=A0A2G3AM74_CAPAN|nr:putative 1-aminocyclopropane-1-carboxylate oxidase -like protein [Capsicum annuum]KAF3661494.1 putative 1-aminocyclopropane-1-carboxylate oxidase -like protein [Capsicum annuum]PHT95337.1 hypothetical protein T459_03219 [Capsicum annuum]